MERSFGQQNQKVEITYDVQWSDDGGIDNSYGPLTQADLRAFLSARLYAGSEVVVTKCCGVLQVGNGCYHKYDDGSFSVSRESPLMAGLLPLLGLPQQGVPLSQVQTALMERPCLRFKKAFLHSVLEEAGWPTFIMDLKREGEARAFVYAQDLNGYWYHLTRNGRYINFPNPRYAQALIVALQCYALEQSVAV